MGKSVSDNHQQLTSIMRGYILLLLLPAFSTSSMNDGVLITGGGGRNDQNTAELYLPSSGGSCSLPNLPDLRLDHSLESTGLLCGGGYLHRDTCIQWNPANGTWERSITLDVNRYAHVSWTPENGIGTFLMGGSDPVMRWTTTLIKTGGTAGAGFSLKYEIDAACAIPDPDMDTVVITGGSPYETSGTVDAFSTKVAVYSPQGWLHDLPPLRTGRYYHACTSFVSGGRRMFLVSGGYGPSGPYGYSDWYDSSEIFDTNLGNWATSGAKLPQPMDSLRATNINDRVLIFGGYAKGSGMSYDDILEYDPEEDSIVIVGKMTRARSSHAVSVVQAEDYLQWCN